MKIDLQRRKEVLLWVAGFRPPKKHFFCDKKFVFQLSVKQNKKQNILTESFYLDDSNRSIEIKDENSVNGQQ